MMNTNSISINTIQEASKKRDELLIALQRSMIIKKFYPYAFEHGSCSCFVTGNPYHPENVKVTFRRKDKEGTIVDETNYHPKELPEEILAIEHIENALISLSNGRRIIPKNVHDYHSGIFQDNQGDGNT